MIQAEKIYDETFSARNFNTSPLTVSGLKGDTYDYELWIILSNITTANGAINIFPNSDTTSNYRMYQMDGTVSGTGASTSDSSANVTFESMRTSGETLLKCNITGSSGDERYMNIFYGAGANRVMKVSSYWKNTADELTSLQIKSSAGATVTDAHTIIYRTPKVASQSRWELMKELSWTNQSSLTLFSGLDGDADKKYRLDIDFTDQGGFDPELRFNSDSTVANYKTQNLFNDAGTLYSQTITVHAGISFTNGNNPTDSSVSFLINAESGVKRLVTSNLGNKGTGAEVFSSSGWWSNTADSISSIQLAELNTSVSHGGTAKLYRLKNTRTTGDTLPFQTVESVSISGDFSAGHTFSGLSGDDYKLIKIEFLGDGDPEFRMQVNSDTGSNYTRQYLRGASSTASASTSTQTSFLLADPAVSKQTSQVLYIYPKSGDNRPMIGTWNANESDMQIHAGWWLNSVDPIDTIKVYATNTGTMTGTLKLSILR